MTTTHAADAPLRLGIEAKVERASHVVEQPDAVAALLPRQLAGHTDAGGIVDVEAAAYRRHVRLELVEADAIVVATLLDVVATRGANAVASATRGLHRAGALQQGSAGHTEKSVHMESNTEISILERI